MTSSRRQYKILYYIYIEKIYIFWDLFHVAQLHVYIYHKFQIFDKNKLRLMTSSRRQYIILYETKHLNL